MGGTGTDVGERERPVGAAASQSHQPPTGLLLAPMQPGSPLSLTLPEYLDASLVTTTRR